MAKEELLDNIIHFERLVKQYNSLLLEHFNVSICPLLAKRNGVIPKSGIIIDGNEVIHYAFHGMGCRFENDKIIDFDYSCGDFTYKGFEVDKLYEFIKSDNNSYNKLKVKDFFLDALSQLELSQLIVKNELNVDTHDYSLAISVHPYL